ncbi:MAG TPA: tail fiber domain-containing protein [Lentimicrobium sp.]|nr:tail fiber domain-containing protein [Lentimicrobium sp.]
MRALNLFLPVILVLTFAIRLSHAQGVMISNDTNAPEPAALLHVYGPEEEGGNVLFEGEFKDPVFQGPPPASAEGTRFMWYPDKAALRAGQVTGGEWNESQIGEHSVALGYNTTARGNFSLAAGQNTSATGINCVALGYNTAASVAHSTAMGYQSIASGAYSTAFGSWTVAPSGFETVIGRYNSLYPQASSAGWTDTDRLFVIGNGTASDSRSDAMVVLKNGNIGIGMSTPQNRIVVAEHSGNVGMHLLGNNNYFQSNLWQFGSTISNPEQGVLSGDFVLKSSTTYHYTFWTSYFRPTTDNTKTLGGSGYRWSTIYAANGTNNTSDARQKQNIRPISYGLDAVMRMKPVLFEWKNKPEDGSKPGFLAQDLLEVIPEVVVTKEKEVDRETGKVSFKEAASLGVYYSDLIPVLAKAIQEQQAMIQQQQETIDKLKDEVDEIKQIMRM